jgi:HSP20 family molecular chaperone IbpA
VPKIKGEIKMRWFNDSYFKTEIGDFFDTFSKPTWDIVWTTSVKSSENIKQEKDKTIVEIELPGYKKENIKVVTTGKLLEVVATGARGDKSYNYTLTDSADVSKISSKFEDAILTIEIPIKESAKPKEVKIL